MDLAPRKLSCPVYNWALQTGKAQEGCSLTAGEPVDLKSDCQMLDHWLSDRAPVELKSDLDAFHSLSDAVESLLT